MLYLQHEFYNIIFKIKPKWHTNSGSAPPPPGQGKIEGAHQQPTHWDFQNRVFRRPPTIPLRFIHTYIHTCIHTYMHTPVSSVREADFLTHKCCTVRCICFLLIRIVCPCVRKIELPAHCVACTLVVKKDV
jgi:hypothetical protein